MARKPANRHRPDDTDRPHFEFCVSGRPISAQAKNRLLLEVWKDAVREAAQAIWVAARPRLQADVELRITHYSERRIADTERRIADRERRIADRDNLMKPIQDALQGIVYDNDRQVRDASCNWRNINGRFTIRNLALPLAIAFSNGSEFLHIRIWNSPDTEDLG